MRQKISFQIKTPAEILKTFEACFNELHKNHPKLYLSAQSKVDIKTAFTEAVANAIKHAGEIDKQGFVEGQFLLTDKYIGFDVIDHGPGYEPAAVPIPDLNDFSASGRGVFMMKQLGDELKYKQQKGKNVLSFRRHHVGRNESTKELDLLYELSEAILKHQNLEEVYQIILDQALELFHVERASILIYDEDLKGLKMIASRGIDGNIQDQTVVKAGDGVSGYVFQHGRSLLIEDIEKNKRGLEKKEHYKTKSFISAPMICSPLRLDERPIGVINLTDRQDGKKFTKKDLKLLSTIANQAMACVHIKGLVEEINHRETLRHEMEQIRLIQDSYLPKRAPEVQGYDVAGRCEMADSVGGDYFDYVKVEDYLYMVVADVTGHNMSSAVTMVNFRSRFLAYVEDCQEPGVLLEKLNQSLFADLELYEHFVSCVILRLNTKTAELEYANAGHYPPLFRSGQLAKTQSGLVMGIEKSETYETFSQPLEKGDAVVLYTDGLIESVNSDEKVYGLDQVLEFVKNSQDLSAIELVHTIVEDVLGFRSITKRRDDVTVLCLRRLD